MLAHPLFRPLTIAVSLVLAALGLTIVCWPLCQWYPALCFIVAVLIAAWQWGLGQGIATTCVAALPLLFFYRNSPSDGLMPWGEVVWRLGLFVLVGGLASYITHLCLWARLAVARLDGTLAAVDDALIFTDERGEVRRLNLVAESLTGWKSADAVGQPLDRVFQCTSGDKRKPTAIACDKVIREGMLLDLPADATLMNVLGGEVCIEGRAAPYRGDPREPTGMVVVFRDVTKRSQEERDCRKRAEQFQALAACAPTAMLFLDQQGRCLFANGAWLTASGLAEKDCLGDGWSRAVHGEDRGRLITEWQHALRAGREFYAECRLQPRRGEVRWLRVSSAPMLSERGQLLGHVGVLEDAEARKQAEAALFESENRFTAFMKNFPGLAFLRDADGRYIYANDAYARVIGCDPGECDGKTDAELLGSNHENPFCSHVEHVLEYQDDRECAETRYGEAIYVVHQFAVPGRENSEVRFGVLAIDITAQKEAEQSLRRAREEFEAKWSERAGDLKRSEDALRKARGDLEKHLTDCAGRQKQSEEALRSARNELEQHRRQLEEHVQARRKSEEALKAATELLDEQVGEHDGALRALQRQLDEKSELLTSLEEQLAGEDQQTARVSELEAANRQLETKLSNLEHERDLERDELAQEQDKLTTEIQTLRQQLSEVEAERETLRRELAEAAKATVATPSISAAPPDLADAAETHQILVHSWRLVENMESWRARELSADWLSYN
jgi:PAS domain S-box-containing protein